MVEQIIQIQTTPRQVAIESLSLPADCDFVVCWYGAMLQGRSENLVPRVVVWFRELTHEKNFGRHFGREVALSYLGQLRIGSIWKNGESTHQRVFDRRKFRLKYDSIHWESTTSFKDHFDKHRELIISDEVYPLYWGNFDRSRILQFESSDGELLLVPCLEFFVRCYGRRQEVNRIISTYGWDELVQRLHLDHPVDPITNCWPIHLPATASNNDAFLLAAARYRSDVQRNIRRIQSSLDSLHKKTGSGGKAFPAIGPWFSGQAELLVEGFTLPEGKFFAVRIVGYSLPQMPLIMAIRDRSESEQAIGEGDSDYSGYGPPIRRIRTASDAMVEPTSDSLGHGKHAEIIDIADPEIKLLGTTPSLKIVNAYVRKRSGRRSISETSHMSSPGEHDGDNDEIGESQFTSDIELQTDGAVADFWNGLLYLSTLQPVPSFRVGWLNAGTMDFEEVDTIFRYVELPSPKAEEADEVKARNSLWLKIHKNDNRGVLVVRVRNENFTGYAFEIEREQWRRKVATSDLESGEEVAEEAFRGLVVIPKPETPLHSWLHNVLAEIVRTSGKMKKVRVPEGCHSDVYKRSSAKVVKVAGQATARLALRKMGLDISEPLDMQGDN